MLYESLVLKNYFRHFELSKLEAGGKPSTWFPPGGLVELITKPNEALERVFPNV